MIESGGMPVTPLSRLTKRELDRFDRSTGIPTALGVIRRHLGLLRTLRVGVSLIVRRDLDPLADVPRAGWDDWREDLCRHQLRTLFHLDDVLCDVIGLDDQAKNALLGDVIVETGARFVAKSVQAPAPEEWAKAPEPERDEFLKSIGERMFNAEIGTVQGGDRELAVDVTACRLVELCNAAGRGHLAPNFCAADSRHFDSEGSLLGLRRGKTIAEGSARCEFRFYYRE